MAIDPKEPDHEKIAKSLRPRVSKQAVGKGLQGANWHVIRETLHRFEETQWKVALPPGEPAARTGRVVYDNQKGLSGRRQPKRVV